METVWVWSRPVAALSLAEFCTAGSSRLSLSVPPGISHHPTCHPETAKPLAPFVSGEGDMRATKPHVRGKPHTLWPHSVTMGFGPSTQWGETSASLNGVVRKWGRHGVKL